MKYLFFLPLIILTGCMNSPQVESETPPPVTENQTTPTLVVDNLDSGVPPTTLSGSR